MNSIEILNALFAYGICVEQMFDLDTAQHYADRIHTLNSTYFLNLN